MDEIDDTEGSIAETADYIANMTHELSRMAVNPKLDFLRYLLEMAREEARAASRRAQIEDEGDSDADSDDDLEDDDADDDRQAGWDAG